MAGNSGTSDSAYGSELGLAAEEYRRIAELGRIVGSTTEFDSVLSKFAEQAQKLVPHDRVVIATWSDDGRSLTDRYIDGIELEGLGAGRTVSLPQDEIWDRLYNQRKPWCVKGDDYVLHKDRNDRERARYEVGLRALLIVPILLQQKVVGSIAFRSTNPDAFDDRQLELAESIASQIAGAVAASERLRELENQAAERQKLTQEQATLAEIGRIVSSSLDIEEVLERFVEQAKQLIPFDRLVISINDEDGINATDAYVSGDELEIGQVGESYPIAGGLKQVATENSFLLAGYEDLLQHAKKWPAEQIRLDAGYRSLLMVPMVSRGIEVGTLMFRTKGEDDYSDDHVSLGKQIAAEIAGAIAASEQVRKLENESATVKRLANEQAVIAEIGRIVSSSLNIDEVFSSFANQARKLIPFDRIAVMLVEEDGKSVVDAFVHGMEDVLPGAGVRRDVEPGTSLHALIESRMQVNFSGNEYVDHASTSPEERKRHELGLNSILASPLIWNEKTIGAVTFRSKQADIYGEHEQALASQICAQIAGAVTTSNQYQLLEQAFADINLQSTALEAADDAIIIRNSDATIQYVNPGFVRQTGFTKDEVIGTDFLYPENDDIPGATKNVWDQLKAGESWRQIVSSRRKDGSEYIVDATVSPIFNEAGEIELFVGVRRDVTESVNANAAIRTQLAALEAADEGFIILTPDFIVEWVNDSFVRDTGYSRDELIGKKAPVIPSGEAHTATFDDMPSTVLAGKPWRATHTSLRKDGTQYHVDSSMTPVIGDDGEIVRLIGTRRDITDIVNAEKEREARRDLDARNRHLLELNEQRQEFFSTVSHELRTPLTAVIAFADILARDRDGTLTGLQKEHIDVIKRNSRNLNDLVEDMLDFSRLSTDKLKLEKSTFEVHSLLNSLVESLEPTAQQRDQSLVIEPFSQPIWVEADYGRIVQVISNLVTNSCKYSPPETQVSIGVELDSENKRVWVRVSDQGIGIEASDIENIFSPFFRTDQSAVLDEQGTGLGLAISKTLVELHGGTIRTESELGEGTSISISLPGASTEAEKLTTS